MHHRFHPLLQLLEAIFRQVLLLRVLLLRVLVDSQEGLPPSTCRQGIRVDGVHKAIVGAPAVAQSLLNGECRRRVGR